MHFKNPFEKKFYLLWFFQYSCSKFFIQKSSILENVKFFRSFPLKWKTKYAVLCAWVSSLIWYITWPFSGKVIFPWKFAYKITILWKSKSKFGCILWFVSCISIFYPWWIVILFVSLFTLSFKRVVQNEKQRNPLIRLSVVMLQHRLQYTDGIKSFNQVFILFFINLFFCFCKTRTNTHKYYFASISETQTFVFRWFFNERHAKNGQT